MSDEAEHAADESDEVRSSATRRSAPSEAGAASRASGGRSSLAPGTLLEGSYRIEAEIGRGGSGVVYRAKHVTLGRSFAVKVVSDESSMDPELALRLVQEARTASAIEHDHIVDVTHLGRDASGRVFVVMELLRGEDLAQRIDRQVASGSPRWLPDGEVREIVAQVLSALIAAHGAGVVHRDLKPGNVYLAERGGRRVVKLVDFGMSKVARADASSLRLTKTGQVIGTPLYMAPEQSRAEGEVDERADVYSLGVILYEMLAGEVPFPATSLYECVLLHATAAPPPLAERRPDLPAGVAALVHRCLEKDPDRRVESAQELLDAWDAAWRGQPVVAPPASRPPAAARRSRGWIALVALAVVALAAALAGMAWSGEPDRPAPRPPAASTAPRPAARAMEQPAPPPEEAAPTAPVMRAIQLTSRPPVARVREGDADLGTTPLTVELAPGQGPRELTLARSGYRSVTTRIELDSPDVIEVELPRERPASRPSTQPQLAPY